MEEPTNLLEDFVSNEPDVLEYHEQYHSVRRITRTLFGIGFGIYLIFLNPWRYDENGFQDSIGTIIGTVIGSAFGLVFIALAPASLFAWLLSYAIDKKYPFKDRFKKIRWWLLLGLSILFLASFGIVAFQNHFIPLRR